MQIRWKALEIPLTREFRIAYGVSTSYTGVLVRVDVDGVKGYGESSPSKMVTGETVGGVQSALAILAERVDATTPQQFQEAAEKVMIYNHSAKAAVDIALWDAMGKRAGMPLWKMLGARRSEVLTSWTVGIAPEEEMIRTAEEYVEQGFRAIKVKIGDDPEKDVRVVRRIADLGVKVWADANQAYTPKKATEVISMIEDVVEFVEQPVPWWDLRGLRFVRNSVSAPIMADEALKSIHDLQRMVEMEAVDAVNIKLQKVGGITPAMEIAALAKRNGLKIMVGCMTETRVGIGAGVHFALGAGVDYADLDGHRDLSADVADGSFTTEGGYHRALDLPGLGLRNVRVEM